MYACASTKLLFYDLRVKKRFFHALKGTSKKALFGPVFAIAHWFDLTQKRTRNQYCFYRFALILLVKLIKDLSIKPKVLRD